MIPEEEELSKQAKVIKTYRLSRLWVIGISNKTQFNFDCSIFIVNYRGLLVAVIQQLENTLGKYLSREEPEVPGVIAVEDLSLMKNGLLLPHIVLKEVRKLSYKRTFIN